MAGGVDEPVQQGYPHVQIVQVGTGAGGRVVLDGVEETDDLKNQQGVPFLGERAGGRS
ncbi:hypothetical protein ACGFZQ_50275 [Streptomyces sp. NPDC048254]|uniref:hypothetical protein n=1 Tax=Streptomyces sp. NPDC048254 TaxID=3365525 RepID=UPI0037130BBD